MYGNTLNILCKYKLNTTCISNYDKTLSFLPQSIPGLSLPPRDPPSVHPWSLPASQGSSLSPSLASPCLPGIPPSVHPWPLPASQGSLPQSIPGLSLPPKDPSLQLLFHIDEMIV